MREILFRGKRVDNGEWVYGDFLQDKDLEQYMIEYFVYYTDEDGLQRDYIQCEVTADTIGQYTGLTDKNGTKIFEGDIIKNQYEENKYQYLKISYCNRTCCWVVVNKYGMSGKLYNVLGDIEVIGNIHDNPELLKEGESNGNG